MVRKNCVFPIDAWLRLGSVSVSDSVAKFAFWMRVIFVRRIKRQTTTNASSNRTNRTLGWARKLTDVVLRRDDGTATQRYAHHMHACARARKCLCAAVSVSLWNAFLQYHCTRSPFQTWPLANWVGQIKIVRNRLYVSEKNHAMERVPCRDCLSCSYKSSRFVLSILEFFFRFWNFAVFFVFCRRISRIVHQSEHQNEYMLHFSQLNSAHGQHENSKNPFQANASIRMLNASMNRCNENATNTYSRPLHAK